MHLWNRSDALPTTPPSPTRQDRGAKIKRTAIGQAPRAAQKITHYTICVIRLFAFPSGLEWGFGGGLVVCPQLLFSSLPGPRQHDPHRQSDEGRGDFADHSQAAASVLFVLAPCLALHWMRCRDTRLETPGAKRVRKRSRLVTVLCIPTATVGRRKDRPFLGGCNPGCL